MPHGVEPPPTAFMRLALTLALRGLEGVSPNPLVGAVLVRRGEVIGRGWHRRFGGAHAEVEAFRDAERRGFSARGSDLHVTLEPCGHQGKTPPCAGAIIERGVRRVFYAVRDPNPLTRGRGPRMLRRAGIEVHEGLLREECTELNEPYLHWITTGMPWVILKWAMTLDGRTAAPSGESRWITGEEARAYAHRLRRRVDAVMVGTETALRDDPRLHPRPPRGRGPWRVILDRRARLPLSLRLLSPDEAVHGGGGRIYVTTARSSARRRTELESRGVKVLVAPEERGLLDLARVFRDLGDLGISQVLVEGGARLHGSLLRSGLAHEVAAFIAPRILGSLGSRPAVDGTGIDPLEATPWLDNPQWRRLGKDYLIHGKLDAGRGRKKR